MSRSRFTTNPPASGRSGERLRPSQGGHITVLVEVGGIPATHQARAGRVEQHAMIVPRRREDPLWHPDVGCRALVLFLVDGKLQAWSMRVEEVLPSSYYLVAIDGEASAERRAFVRAELLVYLAVEAVPPDQVQERLLAAPPPLVQRQVDLSAAGVRLADGGDWQPGDKLAVWLGRHADRPTVRAAAVVIRRLPTPTGWDCACEFEHLDSADEDRLLRLVYESRESQLARRLGQRRSPAQ